MIRATLLCFALGLPLGWLWLSYGAWRAAIGSLNLARRLR